MAALENAKHEAFADAVARGGTAIGAYRQVYGAEQQTAKKQAYLLTKRPEVRARIEELRALIADPAAEARVTALEIGVKLARMLRAGDEETASGRMATLKTIESYKKHIAELDAISGTKQPGEIETILRELIHGPSPSQPAIR